MFLLRVSREVAIKLSAEIDLTSFVCLGGKKSSNAFFFFFFKLHASPKKLLNTEKSTLSSTSNSVTPAHPAEMNPQRKV